jgi:hypothetical protein
VGVDNPTAVAPALSGKQPSGSRLEKSYFISAYLESLEKDGYDAGIKNYNLFFVLHSFFRNFAKEKSLRRIINYNNIVNH